MYNKFMLPTNIKDFIKELFLGAGFSLPEAEEKIQTIDRSFGNIVVAKILEKIPADKQKEIAAKLKKAANPAEVVKILGEFFADNLTKDDFQRLYQEELAKILEEILKPLREVCTPQQLQQVRRLAETKYPRD